MKHQLLSIYILVAWFVFLSCEKEEPPVLTGNIIGTVNLTDDYGFSVQDRSGVQVQLSFEDFYDETTTDAAGVYTFQDVPFGNYDVNLIRDNYIESIIDFRLGHAGGNASTLTSQSMNGIPEYRYSIDSLQYNGSYKLNFYLTLSEATRSFANAFGFVHCFFSHSPDVSSVNYENNLIEFVPLGPEISNMIVLNYIFYGGYYNFLNDYNSTVYCRIYPQTHCDKMWYSNGTSGPHPSFPETLGKPSEVYSFTVDGITSEF